jgi:prepilin-type N-terminal cleavage/methylation domain-containing protein
MRKIRASNTGGFTLIEVMIALVVFIAAVVGLVSLQRASIAGTDRGRQHTAGVNIARYFLNELKVEIENWEEYPQDAVLNNCDPDTDTTNNLYLVARALNTNCVGTWTYVADEITQVDEFLGHEDMIAADTDSTSNNPNSHYCVHYKIDPIPLADGLRAIVWQIRVRVAWSKSGQYANWEDCDPALFLTGGDRASSADIVELTAFASRELSQ